MAAVRGIGWAQALRWRMARQFLDGPRAASVPEVVQRLTAVPSWSGDAELAVALRRSEDATGGVAAAFERGELIKTFAFRGASHFFTPDAVGIHLALRSIGRQWELPSWREFYRLESTDWPILRAVVR